jgi:hypothetical protein
LAPSAVPGTVVATVNGLHAKAIVDMLLGATAWYFPDPGRVTSFYLEQAESSFWEHEVKDSDRLELDRLLKCNLEELIASVRPMSAKNCEQIVRAMLDRIGGPTFEQLLTRIVGTMVPRDGRGPPTNSDEYYFAIRDLFPQVSPENDVLGRLLCFALRMCQLRIEKSLNLTAH